MKVKVLPVFIIVFFSLPYSGNGQDIMKVPLRWETDQTVHVLTGEFVEERTTLFVYGKDRIEWRSSNGDIKRLFRVSEVIGIWRNVSRGGETTYEVHDGEIQGAITFVRNGQETKIKILLMHQSEPEMIELSVSGVQPIKE